MRIKLFAILILIGCFATACPAPCAIKDNEVAGIHADGARLVSALENFKASEQKYPRTLAELSPKYLDKVPETIGNRKFSYWTSEDGKYNLRIASPGGSSYSGSCSYSEIEERWQELAQSK